MQWRCSRRLSSARFRSTRPLNTSTAALSAAGSSESRKLSSAWLGCHALTSTNQRASSIARGHGVRPSKMLSSSDGKDEA
eukprot:scaffold123725_cov63-Phaeocystis_antarctica.AAC.1